MHFFWKLIYIVNNEKEGIKKLKSQKDYENRNWVQNNLLFIVWGVEWGITVTVFSYKVIYLRSLFQSFITFVCLCFLHKIASPIILIK